MRPGEVGQRLEQPGVIRRDRRRRRRRAPPVRPARAGPPRPASPGARVFAGRGVAGRPGMSPWRTKSCSRARRAGGRSGRPGRGSRALPGVDAEDEPEFQEELPGGTRRASSSVGRPAARPTASRKWTTRSAMRSASRRAAAITPRPSLVRIAELCGVAHGPIPSLGRPPGSAAGGEVLSLPVVSKHSFQSPRPPPTRQGISWRFVWSVVDRRHVATAEGLDDSLDVGPTARIGPSATPL